MEFFQDAYLQYPNSKYPHQRIFLPFVHLKISKNWYRHREYEYIAEGGQNPICQSNVDQRVLDARSLLLFVPEIRHW